MLTTCALTSCESSEDVIVNSVNEQTYADSELVKLYNSIDSLHNEYSDFSRSSYSTIWGRRFLVSAFDACVGAITAESGPGAFICSTIASGLYDDYLDAVNRYYTKTISYSFRSASAPQSVVFSSSDPSFVDSIGYYHNLVINEIQSKGESFIDYEDKIDYESYYNEVIKVSKENGILCNSEIDKPLVFRYIDSIIRPFAQIQAGDEETILSIIFNETYNDFNYDNSKTLQLREVCEKIIYNDLTVNEAQVVEYGSKVNELIEDSNVDLSAKETMKVANNVAVNSSLYWSAD